ncbi:MAG TPA: hypothetical protein VFG53_10685 [Anaeromyxobacter sp.]|nr:hypothetical protein [Anaeromyxobacter sp.]
MDAGTDGAPGYTDELAQRSYRLNVVYRIIEALSLSATVPLLNKSIQTVGGGTSLTASSLQGVGDVELAARYALWTSVYFGARRVQEVAVSAGSSVPTGQYNARDSTGALVDPHGQLGTGGWGPFAGLHYRFEQGDFMAFASLSYRLRTEATYFDKSRYEFGNAVLWSLHGQYRPGVGRHGGSGSGASEKLRLTGRSAGKQGALVDHRSERYPATRREGVLDP